MKSKVNSKTGLFSQHDASKSNTAETIFHCFEPQNGGFAEFGDLLTALSKKDFSTVKKVINAGCFTKESANKYGADVLHFAVYYDCLPTIDNILGEKNLDSQRQITIMGEKYNAIELAELLGKNNDVIDLLQDMFPEYKDLQRNLNQK